MIESIGDWKEIFIPQNHSKYVNDHTIFADAKNNFHLIGTTAKSGYAFYRERFFIEATATKIDGNYQEKEIIFDKTPHDGIKIAPFVICSQKDKKFHLFFGPGKIYHYTSADGENWDFANIAIQTLWPLTRDPHVISHEGEYLMYLTASNNRISVYRSDDLYNWKYLGNAFRLGVGAPRSINSACESTSVIEHKNKFYLFTTVTPAPVGGKKHYNNTLVFISDNPYKFGTYSPKLTSGIKPCGSIEAHAPEIFIENDKIFCTTCGWPHMPKPNGIKKSGVYIKELKIAD